MFINPFRPVRFLSWSHHVPNWLGHSSSSSLTYEGKFNTPAAPCSLHSTWNITEATMHQESRRLETTLQSYHNRLIDAAAVIQTMIAIKEDLAASERRAESLGLSEDELAFYDAVHSTYPDLYDDAFLRDLIHEVVASVRRNLKVDWTEPHREDIKAAVRSAVKRMLRHRKVKREDLDTLVVLIMDQAEALYKDWPQAA